MLSMNFNIIFLLLKVVAKKLFFIGLPIARLGA